MSNWNNEAEAREEILKLVEQYYHDFKEQKKEFVPGDRINYNKRRNSFRVTALTTLHVYTTVKR